MNFQSLTLNPHSAYENGEFISVWKIWWKKDRIEKNTEKRLWNLKRNKRKALNG